MDEDQFWKIVDTAKAQSTSAHERPERLESLLEVMPAAEVLEFEKQFQIAADNAYDHNIWAAAYLLNGGCSDDCFIDFRSWLISSGRAAYNSVLNDPDSAGAFYQRDEGATLEDYGYVAWRVYANKTGSGIELSDWDYQPRSTPTGTIWEEENLPELLPKTYKVVADEWRFSEDD